MKEALLKLALLLLVGLLGLFVWATRNPGSPWVERAEEWPVAGIVARWLRAAYLPPEPAPASDEEVEPEIVYLRRPAPDRARSPSGYSPPSGAREMAWVGPDLALLAEPRPGAAVVLTPEVIANVPVLERRGGWLRVEMGDQSGWIPEPPPGPPPLGSAPEPTRPVPALAPEPTRLARAREILGLARPYGWLGPYRLYTDHFDDALIDHLDRVAANVEEVYVVRTGRRPIGRAAEAAILFRQEADYRSFQSAERRLAGLASSGHAGHGLIVLYADRQPRWQVVSTLVHEIAHLLNRRAIGPALPSWLDEGIASDLGLSRVGADGTPQPGTLGGAIVLTPGRIDFHGGQASLRRLVEGMDAGRTLPVQSLLALDWERFVEPSAAELRYSQAAFFVRYLFDGEGGSLARRFRAFLDAVADGEPATGEALREHLDRDWQRIELGFRAWVRLVEATATAE